MDAHARRVGLVLALGGLMTVVDTTVIPVALPQMTTALHASLPTLGWATSGYLLAVVTVIPFAAWSSARFGDRRVYLAALATFIIASLAAGAAPNAATLLAARIVQGFGGGLLNPVGTAIGLRSVPRAARGAMMSLLGIPVLFGAVLGPPLSGTIIDIASWRWIFWINVPIGLVAIGLVLAVLPPTQSDGPARPRLDWIGALLLPGAAALVVLGCTLIGNGGGLAPGPAAAVAAGIAMLALFGWHARRAQQPIVNLALFGRRTMAAGALVLAPFAAAYFGSMSILPVFVQGVRGDSALLAGTLAIPTAIAVGLTLQVATRLTDRVRPHRIVLTGTSLGTAGLVLLLAAAMTNAPYWALAAGGVVLGIGSGATLQPTMTTALRDFEGADTASGSTILNLIAQASSALGTAIVTTTIALLLTHHAGQPGGLADILRLDPASRLRLAPELASSVGLAYAVPALLAALATAAAALLLRKSHTTSTAQQDGQNTELEEIGR